MVKLGNLVLGALVILLLAAVAGVSASAPSAGDRFGEAGTTVPGWEQVNSSGFGDPQTGEVSALEAFNGYLYAGIHNPVTYTQIFRTPNGTTWTPVIDPGFGISHDIAPTAILDMMVFNGRLYASTGRRNAGQLWRTQNGTIWAPMTITGFSDPDNVDFTALAAYGGKIYAGVTNQVTGAQIWSSYTGDNNSWTQVAPAAPGTDAAAITAFAEFDGGLYAAVESQAPAQIWRSFGGDWETVVSDGFGSSNTTSTSGMAVFGGYLWVGAGNTQNGALLYRTADGDVWEQAITPGFGDANNTKVDAVFIFQNQLYAGVQNAVTGIELWRTADGALWEQANPDGFGDGNNVGTNWSNATAEFLNQLYVGTINGVDGGEVWRMLASSVQADLSTVKVDAIDPVVVGDTVVYTVTVSNGGPDPAQNVTLTDTLPGPVTFISAMPSQGSCSEAGGTVSCAVGPLSTGASATVVIAVATTESGVLTNHAAATADTADPTPGNNSDSEDTTVGCYFADVHPNPLHNLPALCDDDVDIADIQTVAGCWNQVVGSNCPAALDFPPITGVIDLQDVITAAGEWGWQPSLRPAVSLAP